MSPLLVASVWGAGYKDTPGVKPYLRLFAFAMGHGHSWTLLKYSRRRYRFSCFHESCSQGITSHLLVSFSNAYWQLLRNRLSVSALWLQKYLRGSSRPETGVKRPGFLVHRDRLAICSYSSILLPLFDPQFSQRKDADHSESVPVPKGLGKLKDLAHVELRDSLYKFSMIPTFMYIIIHCLSISFHRLMPKTRFESTIAL